MNSICYLCGEEIIGEKPTKDHVVPDQFRKRPQPKAKGFDYAGHLPTHLKCNTRFGPEKMASKALQVLNSYQNQVFTNIKHPEISIQVFRKKDLGSLSEKDLEFFGLIDTTKVAYDEWAHNPDFFNDKKRGSPFKKPLNIALSVLTKSAAALLVKRFGVSPKSNWNILCFPYKLQKSDDDFVPLLGEVKPFDIGIKIWVKQYTNGKDFIVWHKNEKNFFIIIFTFSEKEECKKAFLRFYRGRNRYVFKSSKLMDLINYDWTKNCIPPGKPQRDRVIMGVISSLVGVFILLLSFNVIPLDEKLVHAPVWVLASIGLIFLFAGLALFARRGSAVTLFFVALLLTLMAGAFTWITVGAEAGSIEGGESSFLLGALSQITGRLLFGLGALLLWIFAFYTWKSFIGRWSSGSKA